ncbi:hypothetical protein PHMEG_00022983, partial [Phytophthora megakarya]
PRQRLVWGCLLIGYFFLLRRSEFLKIGKSYHFYCLKRRNAFFSDDEGRRTSYKLATSVTVGLEGAKNDQFGRGSWRTMSASGNKTLCPIQGLRHVLQARKLLRQEVNPHLCAGLTVQSVVQVIKSTARRIGVPAAKYSSHSIRIGGATALASAGASKIAIKFIGRWLSDCFEEYPRHAASSSKGLSRLMIR